MPRSMYSVALTYVARAIQKTKDSLHIIEAVHNVNRLSEAMVSIALAAGFQTHRVLAETAGSNPGATILVAVQIGTIGFAFQTLLSLTKGAEVKIQLCRAMREQTHRTAQRHPALD